MCRTSETRCRSLRPAKAPRAFAREAETIEQHAMIEKIAWQRGALTQPMLFEQLSARRKIQRTFRAHVAGDTELAHERFQAGDGIEAGAIARAARSKPSSSLSCRSGWSISHSSIEVEAAVLPWPGNAGSTMTTSSPCRVRRSATNDPVMPAPTMSASHLRFSPTSRREGCPDFANHGDRPPRRSACSVSSESRTLIANL